MSDASGANRGHGAKRYVVASVCAALALSGCGLSKGLYNVTLPGGADLGDHAYTVVAEFDNALDLVPQSGVRVNGVAVGRVDSIALSKDGRHANVSLLVNGNVHLPANAIASIEQTTLLGEKYVSLAPPLDGAPSGTLDDHAVIPETRTNNGVEVEQVFGALALLLNGGGIAQLHDITRQLNAFATGNEPDIKRFLSSVDSVVRQLNEHRDSITSVLDSLDTLSATLKDNDGKVRVVLADLSPGIRQLAQQKDQLVGMLNALNNLSRASVNTIEASRNDIASDLQLLSPILRNLADTGSALPKSLQLLLTFPFTDDAVAGIKGDYLNSWIVTNYKTANRGTSSASEHSLTAPPAGLLPATDSAATGLAPTLSISGGGK